MLKSFERSKGYLQRISGGEVIIKFIDKPTTYEGGPFYEVVCIAFDAVGLLSEDLSRAIRAALKNQP